MSITVICLFSSFSYPVVSGIPDGSEEDLSVARALYLSWRMVLKTHRDETQTLINSQEVSSDDGDHVIHLVLLYRTTITFHSSWSLCSSQTSPGSRRFTQLPRRPESRRLGATSPAPSSETGWYPDSVTGAHPSQWCTVTLVARSPSLRRSYRLLCLRRSLSQGKGRRLWEPFMIGSTANVPGGKMYI